MPDEGLSEPTSMFSAHLEVSPERAAAWKRAQRDLVAERNRLIHKDLLNVDFESREECEDFCERLDEQYTRIRQQLDYLNSVRTGFGKLYAELRRRLESDELQASLSVESDDA